jgi:hypothetical protein
MDNVVDYLPGCTIALILEFVVFFGFTYFVSRKTYGEVSRRWKASAFMSVCFGVFVQLLVLAIVVFVWLLEKDIQSMFMNFSMTIISFVAVGIVIGATVTMPVVVIGLFIAYHNFWQSGDRFIEKYWRNPKIHYGANRKPPFLDL